MTKEEIKNTPELVDFILDKSVLADSRIKVRKRLEEVCDLAIKALEQEPCEDAISRQIISDYVESHIQEINTGYGDLNKHTNEILRMIVDYIEKMESVTPKPKTEWIPVSERLPESCGMYIVTRKIYDCPDTAPIIMSDESWFDGQNTWHNDNRINHNRGYLSDVIAWMPLPEPYKAESEDKE